MKMQLRAVSMAVVIAVVSGFGFCSVAHAGDVTGMNLKTVTFGTGALTIKKDDEPHNDYETPHYDISRQKQSPFGVKSGERNLSAMGTFSVLPTNATNPVKVRATGTYFSFPAKDCTPAEGVLTYPNTMADTNSSGFPNSINQ